MKPGRKSTLVRAALVLGAALLLAAGLAGYQLAPLLLEPNAYADVASIERESEYQNADLLRAAWSSPVAARFASVPYEFQHNQSVCGPTSVADVLHSLGEPLSQEQVLANSPYRTWFGYLLGGLTLDQEAELMKSRTGRRVEILRDLTLDQFRARMREVNDPARRYVVNFHRGPLFGRGHGHFSPLVAYLPDRDLVLVGDVNAAYRPFLVPTDRLWQAADTVDSATGRKRGLIEVAAP